MTDANDPPPNPPDPDAPPDSAPPEPIAGPPLGPEESRRRSTIMARAELLAALRETLKGCAKRHRNDILNEGIVDALAAEGFPLDEGSLVFDFVAAKITNARKRFYYYQAKAAEHDEVDDRVPDVPTAAKSAPDKLDAALDVAEQLAADDSGAARALDILKMRHVDGLSQEEAAAKANMSVAASYKATKRFTRILQGAVAGIAVAVAWLFGPGLARDFLHPNAHDMTADHPLPPPPPSAAPDPKELSAPIVQAALAACDAQDWRTCLSKLNEAGGIDPTIYDDPRVQAARQAVRTGLSKESDEKAPRKGPAPKAPAR
jgi:hypothetical protein